MDAATGQTPADPLQKSPVKRHRARRVVLVTIAACLLFVLGVGTVAAAYPSFEHFLYRMGSDLRSLVQPVGLVSTSKGIRMEVLAAVNDGTGTAVYLSLQDQKGDRIDENTFLYHLDIEGYFSGYGEQVDYDPETKTAIFLLSGQARPGTKNEPVTISLHTILLGYQRVYELDTGLTLAEIVAQNPAPVFSSYNTLKENMQVPAGNSQITSFDRPAAQTWERAMETGTLPMLATDNTPLLLANPAAWVDVTAAGIAPDGSLHLQYAPSTEGARYGYTEFYLNWPGYDEYDYLNMPARMHIGLGKLEEYGFHDVYDYYENILEIPEDVPYEDLSLCLWGDKAADAVHGNWDVSFTLQENPPMLECTLNKDLIGWQLQRVTVSSIGVSTYGKGETQADSLGAQVQVFLKDGTEVQFAGLSSISNHQEETIVDHNHFSRPINIADIGKVLLNGKELDMQPVG